VVLDLRADDRVGAILGGEHVLELVEDDQRALSMSLVQPPREGEALEEWWFCLGVDRDLDRSRDGAAARPHGRSQHPPHAAEPRSQAPRELLGVGALDALRDVVQREYAEEVDVDRCPALPLRVVECAPQQGGLAEPARRDHPRVVALAGALQQDRGLGVPVDELINRHRLAIAEWVLVALARREHLCSQL
jgi:hypothetical protein